jgi:hypothetical protein
MLILAAAKSVRYCKYCKLLLLGLQATAVWRPSDPQRSRTVYSTVSTGAPKCLICSDIVNLKTTHLFRLN